MSNRGRYESPYPPYDPTDVNGFSYETVTKRWPSILNGLIKYMEQASASSEEEVRRKEGEEIIGKARKLMDDMACDRSLVPFEDDGGLNVPQFNQQLETLGDTRKNTWMTAPWLFAECYLYGKIWTWFTSTKYWSQHDPFLAQKESSFKSSYTAVLQLAQTMQQLYTDRSIISNDPAKLDTLWDEMIQMCLWGNATTVGKAAQEQRKEYILRDDSLAAWKRLKSRKGRVDIVLDNSGFELFTDLLFADFLLSITPYITEVVFHPKTIPWFVSDVVPPDVDSMFRALDSPSDFFQMGTLAGESTGALTDMAKRWRGYFDEAKFRLSVARDLPLGMPSAADFWTSPYPYWDMQRDAPMLVEDLRESSLVVFKGDLKLTGDVQWPVSTPFEKALGPLSQSAIHILSLRTNKADVVVGVDEEVASRVAQKDPKWRVNGSYALISYLNAKTSH